MPVTVGPRTGVTQWSDGDDPFTRAQMAASHAAVEDLMALDGQGTLAARPAAGIRGRYYFATDNGIIYRDTGAAWTSLNDHGAQVGLADDDHTQYHNDARGDARYPTLSLLTTRGDLAKRGAATWERLAIGAAGRYLRSDGTDPSWELLASADISDLAEFIRDTMGAALTAGTNITVTPNDGGDIITIAANTGRPDVLVVKNSDESVTSSSTVQDDNELLAAMLANTDYKFDLWLHITCATVTDIKVAFTAPAGAAIAYDAYAPDTNETLATNGTTVIATAAGVEIALSPIAVTEVSVRISGYVRNGANAGNLTLRWAQVGSSATPTVVKAGSWLHLVKEGS